MRLAPVLLVALLMGALPAVSSAQCYVEVWSGVNEFLGVSALNPQSFIDIDGDSSLEVVLNVNAGGSYHVRIRDLATGITEFLSEASGSSPWTFYYLPHSSDAAYEILASSSTDVLLIDYVCPAAVPGQESGSVRDLLRPARPNPFEAHTMLPFDLATAGHAEVEIYDVAGRLVRRLGGERMEPGERGVRWDGRDQSGRTLAPGVYLYRLSVDGRTTGVERTVRLGR